jgi:hypothetical protein
MSDTETKPLPRTDADAVSLDLVWAAAYAQAFFLIGEDRDMTPDDRAIRAADRAVAALVKRRSR